MEQEILEQLLSRASVKKLQQPAPNSDELYYILSCAARAPDHKKLQPWRLLHFKADTGVKLGQQLAELPLAQLPEHQKRVQKCQGQLAKPLVIALVAKLIEHEGVPQYEQILTIGGAAMNLLNAAHFLGYAAFWSSTLDPIDKLLPGLLGLAEDEQLFGLIAIGTAATEEVRVRAEPAAFSREVVL